MVFSSFEFLVFFPTCLAVYWGLRAVSGRAAAARAPVLFLLAASYYFYMSWNAIFVVLIAFSTAVDYVAGLWIHRSQRAAVRRTALIVSLGVNLGTLALFKYANFFLSNVEAVSSWFGYDVGFAVALILPVGISFYTFQSMSYTIDIYRGRLEPISNFAAFALFVSFFPQLVAGPIVRASEFLPQLAKLRRARDVDVRFGVFYILSGMTKKVLIADHVATVADPFFASPAGYDPLGAWVGVLAYSIQIYCDFSGYSDIAIGTAELLGFRLPMNFNMPYLATSVTDFWRRWHISLSTWLRDYLYIPLGGNRGSPIFTERNIMITMLLGGLWHGASWNFVVWGALHGVALVVHKRIGPLLPSLGRGAAAAWAGATLSRLGTFVFVCFCWVFFRALSFSDSWVIIRKMTLLDRTGTTSTLPSVFIAAVVLMAAGHLIGYYREKAGRSDRLPTLAWPLEGVAYGVVVVALVLFAPDGTEPFIYFQF